MAEEDDEKDVLETFDVFLFLDGIIVIQLAQSNLYNSSIFNAIDKRIYCYYIFVKKNIYICI